MQKEISLKVEDLGFDKNRKISSMPVIKYGLNRGLRHCEKNGEWVAMSGHTVYSRQQEKANNYTWAKNLINLGFRVGKTEYEDCINFFLYKKYE